MEQHGELIVERGEVTVHALEGPAQVDEAVALLDAAEAHAGAPLVDESERERLRALATGRHERPPHWHPALARQGGRAVGYAGMLLPAGGEPSPTGDVAVHRGHEPSLAVLAALLDGVEALARAHEARDIEVWLRQATADEMRVVDEAGFAVARRLGVLARPLTDLVPAEPPPGVSVRAYLPQVDDAAVVRVLAAAYADTPEAGWDRDRFRARRELDWFRPEDLLVAEDTDGRIVGLHWLKRRSPRVGEVYNLAVDPSAQGLGLGPVLLAAGLSHLRSVGCDEVLLWVDLANQRASQLYTSAGFELRWEDLALTRELGSG